MVRGVILATDGISDTQLEYAFYRLLEEGALVDVLTPGGEPIAGRNGVDLGDPVPIGACPPTRYDVVIVPEGVRVDAFDEAALRSWLRTHDAQYTVLAAIGDGVCVLGRTGLLAGHRASGPPTGPGGSPTAENPIHGVEWRDDLVTVDGHVVTAGAGSALPYLVAAALDSIVLRQHAADELIEQPTWQ